MIQKTQKLRFILFLFVFFFLTFSFFTSNATANLFDEFNAMPLTTAVLNQINELPSIAIYQKNIHVVWNTQNFGNSTIQYKKSSDNGKTWDNTTELFYNMTHAHSPVVAVYKNTVHIAWTDYRHGNSEIYYSKSTDNGITWENPKRLTYDSPIKNTIYDVVIVSDKENVYIAWKDYRTGSSEIFFKKSRDSGATWDEDQRLTKDYTPSYCPYLAVDGNYLYIAYQDGGSDTDICFIKSEFSGDQWEEKTYVVQSQNASKNPALSVSENALFLVWQDDRTGAEEIFFRKSNDRGETWGEIQELTNDSTRCINPKIYVYDKNILVFWQELINNKFCISYKISTDTGDTWSERKYLTKDSDCYSIDITGEYDNIHIVYQIYNADNSADIYYMGNYSKTPAPVIPEPPVPSTNNETPGFQFTILLMSLSFIFCLKILLKKRMK